jgi:hypothetical protein
VFSEENILKIKNITDSKIKISIDGLYYLITILTENDIKFTVLIYSRPENDYTEIVSYKEFNKFEEYFEEFKDVNKYENKIISLK